MRIPGIASIVVTGCIALGTSGITGAAGALAQTAASETFTYKLEKTSRFDTGCFSMCACPIVTHPIQGTFSLQHTGVDPLYDYYAVTDVRWVVSDATTYATIHGSGTYKRGGEFALVHQLVLDLSVDGAPTQRFDSGLIVGGSEWPHIVIDISLHRNTACVDTLIHVDATDPLVTGLATSGVSAAPWVKAAPNPFREGTEVGISLLRPSRVDVIVYDAAGHAVRHLFSGGLSSGIHVLPWDGRRDQGGTCASGVYFVSARAGKDVTTSRIVKLD